MLMYTCYKDWDSRVECYVVYYEISGFESRKPWPHSTTHTCLGLERMPAAQSSAQPGEIGMVNRVSNWPGRSEAFPRAFEEAKPGQQSQPAGASL